MAELRLLVELLDLNEISLRALYIASARNIVADHFSRIARRRDYMLEPELFAHVCASWGPFTVDAFASEATRLLDRFWDEGRSPSAEAVDAFAQDWSEETVWAHPPPFLLPQLVQFLRAEPHGGTTVCVPAWPSTSWYPELMHLSSEMLSLPPGSLRRVAFDAPAHLEGWGLTCFHVRRSSGAATLPDSLGTH